MKRVALLFALLFTAGVTAHSQTTHTVTGKILDENGQGFPGAGITVKGMQIGTVSDMNGDFMLEVPDGNGDFIIQAQGYNTRIAGETDGTINVKLQPLSKELEGPVRTAQNIKREKRELGYNNTHVIYDDLVSGNNTSVISALQGKVAGANITSSTGGPGGSSRIVLRGENSLIHNNNALIVVDGVITNNYDRTRSSLNAASSSFTQLNQVDFGNSANDLIPEDVESATVLNGAQATALYGAQGAHGAVMYTTKKGKHNESGKRSKMDITYKMSYTQSDVLKYADVQHEFGQGNIYSTDQDAILAQGSWGRPFDNVSRPWGQAINGKQLAKKYSDAPGNIKSFFNYGKNLNNFVSLAGGTDKTTYLFSLNSLNSSGVVPNTFYNKYSVRFNGATQLTNHVYTSIDVNYLNTYSRAETSGAGAGSPLDALYAMPRDIPVWEMKDYGNKYYSMQYYDTAGIERYGNAGRNPYWISKQYDNRNKTDRVIGDFKIGYKKGSFNVYNRFGADISSDRSTYNTPQYNVAPEDPRYSTTNASLPTFNVSSAVTSAPFNANNMLSAGGYTQSNYNTMRLYNDLVVNFNHELSHNFGINAMVGHNTTIMQDQTLAGIIDPVNNGLILPNFYNLQNSVGPVTAYNNLDNRRIHGLYADVVLNYQKELFFELSGRNDWSSSMDQNRASYFYPAANASLVFTERLEGGAFKDKVLNYGKFRVGGGAAGNSPLAYLNNAAGYTGAMINTQNGSVNTPFNGINTYQLQNTIGDNHLRPEQTREIELGTDLAFLRNRISMSFTFYSKITDDLITAVPLPASSGFSYEYTNIGSVKNSGVELSMRGTPIATRWGLKWDLFGTYTKNNSTVLSLKNGLDQVTIGGFDGMNIVAATGKPFGTFYAADIEYWKNPKTNEWHAVVDQKTGLPVATKKPVYKGSFQPKFIASWGTDLSYRGVKLHVLFVTKQGGQFYSRNKMIMDFNGTSEATTVNNRQAYVWTNSVYQVANTNIYLPNTTKYLPYDYFTGTQQTVPAQGLVNASYVRLQEISLSYKIPTKYYKRSPFGGLEAGLFGNNLILWTAASNKYDDPEATSAGALGNGQGLNYTARPSLRNFGAFVKVNF